MWNFLRRDDSHEFRPDLLEIEEEPANPAGRLIIWLVILFFFLFILWAAFSKVDVVISARGVIIPEKNIKEVQVFEEGIVSKIYVKEGDFVRKGDLLVQLDPVVSLSKLRSIEARLRFISVENQRLEALINNKNFIPVSNNETLNRLEEAIYRASKSYYRQYIASISEKIEALKSQIETLSVKVETSAEILQNLQSELLSLKKVEKIIGSGKLFRLKEKIISINGKKLATLKKIKEIKDNIVELQREKLSFESMFRLRLLSKLEENRREYTDLKSSYKQLSFKYRIQYIRSPVDGWIGRVLIHTIGGIVTPAQKLMTIIPSKGGLIIKAKVMNRDIGFVKRGMLAKIKLDAFDFQKYGVLSGRVFFISKNSLSSKDLGRVYNVLIKPESMCLLAAGKKRCLKPGMTATVEIRVRKRRVLEFFIYPILKYWEEGISVR